MRASEVFTPGKLPAVTYVEQHLVERSKLLADALETDGVVISLSGPSKSGKTVFIEANIGRDRLVQVTGAGVDSPDKLWNRVFEIIGTNLPQSETTTSGYKVGVTGKVGAKTSVLVAGASGEAGASGGWSRTNSLQTAPAVDHLQLLISELRNTGFVVFIDDFHYIPSEVQVEISNQIKEAVRNGVIFVVASVPYHSDDAVRANPDLRGRLVKIDFDYWDNESLSQIGELGFLHLNVNIHSDFLLQLAAEAAGSPQLMQSLCLTACFELDVRETLTELTEVSLPGDIYPRVCTRVAATSDYSSTSAKMREGPKTRGQDRKSYLLKTDEIFDVYPLILKAISLDPPELTIRYANLQARIENLCSGEQPSGSSVAGACNHMASIANESENRIVIEWDSSSDVLDLRDPYLLFYLRWGHRHS